MDFGHNEGLHPGKIVIRQRGMCVCAFLLVSVNKSVECESVLPAGCKVHHLNIFIPTAIIQYQRKPEISPLRPLQHCQI